MIWGCRGRVPLTSTSTLHPFDRKEWRLCFLFLWEEDGVNVYTRTYGGVSHLRSSSPSMSTMTFNVHNV